MSLPRVLSLDEQGLRIEPAPELERLRWNPRELSNIEVTPQQAVPLETVQGDTLELSLTVDLQSAKRVGVKLRQTPDSAEETVVWIDREAAQLAVDVSRSTLDPRIRYRTWCITRPTDPEETNRRVTMQQAPLPIKEGEPVQLRIFLDRSMLEVFANGRQCLTQRVWPTRSDATRVSLVSEGGTARVQKLAAWDMAASQPD